MTTVYIIIYLHRGTLDYALNVSVAAECNVCRPAVDFLAQLMVVSSMPTNQANGNRSDDVDRVRSIEMLVEAPSQPLILCLPCGNMVWLRAKIELVNSKYWMKKEKKKKKNAWKNKTKTIDWVKYSFLDLLIVCRTVVWYYLRKIFDGDGEQDEKWMSVRVFFVPDIGF